MGYVGGTYQWGNGNKLKVAKASVVVVHTNQDDVSGCGEFTPCGENYMVAHSEGVEAAAKLIAPKLIGEDPRQVEKIDLMMDDIIQGHGYAKAPFIAACWDILGKATKQPVWMLMGGKLTDGAPLYRVAPQKKISDTKKELKKYKKMGYRQFQLKVGGDWVEDIKRIKNIAPLIKPPKMLMCDANQGWKVHEAIQVVNETKGLNYILEQPCKTYEECLQVRRVATQPLKLDECIDGIKMAQKIVNQKAAEICCLKISNLGGLSKAKKIRDFLVSNRIPIVAEDTWGGEITTATIAHFAASTPEEFLVNTTDLMNYNTKSTGVGGPKTKNGKMFATDTPGLGVEPHYKNLGKPVAIYE